MRAGLEEAIRKAVNWKVTRDVFSWALNHCPGLLPLKPLRKTSNWVVYVHPTPLYPVHLVILPRANVTNWMALPSEDGLIMADFIRLTQAMISDFELEPAGYRLIMNGGANQTFPHLHFHLVAGDQLPKKNEEQP